jgi:hypothetical protein
MRDWDVAQIADSHILETGAILTEWRQMFGPISQPRRRKSCSFASAGQPVEGNADDAEICLFGRDIWAMQIAPIAMIAIFSHMGSPEFANCTFENKRG